MTIHGWLSVHEEGSPDALRASVREALGDDVDRPAADAPQTFIQASERVLRGVLQSDPASRDTALDLLTADALLTYAFEAASEVGGSMTASVDEAVRRINALDAELGSTENPR